MVEASAWDGIRLNIGLTGATEVAKDEVQVLFGRERCQAHDAVLSALRNPASVCSQPRRPVNTGAVGG
jgi:hypothetical protein